MAGKKRQASKKKVAGSFCRSSKCTSYSPPPRNCHLICRPYPLDSLAPTVLGWVETWQFPKHDNFQGVTHLCGFSLHPLTQEAGD